MVHSVFGNLFTYYVLIVNNLNDIYDQTLQVQKRAFLQKLLEAVTKRLLEIKQKLSAIELSDIVYVDHTLISNKITPPEIALTRPYYLLYNRSEEIQNMINKFREEKLMGANGDEECEGSVQSVRSSQEDIS